MKTSNLGFQRVKSAAFLINCLILLCVFSSIYGIKMEYIFVWLILSCFFLSVLLHRCVIDIQVVFLLVGMIIHSFNFEDRMEKYIYSFMPFLFYCFGKLFVFSEVKKERIRNTKVIILILTLGLFCNSILNAFMYYSEGFSNGRRWKEFWSQMDIPATQHVFWSLLIVGLMFYGVYYFKKDIILNGIIVIGGLWSLWFSLVTGSRLLCMVFILVLGMNAILYVYLNRDKKTVMQGMKICVIAFFVLSMILIGVWVLNLFDCRYILKNSFWSRDGGILHNIRFEAQISALKQLLEYPFGGRQMQLPGDLYFVHNVWLDISLCK